MDDILRFVVNVLTVIAFIVMGFNIIKLIISLFQKFGFMNVVALIAVIFVVFNIVRAIWENNKRH